MGGINEARRQDDKRNQARRMESNDGKAKWAWSGHGGGALLASSSYLISIIITAGIDGVLALVSVFLPRLRRARRGGGIGVESNPLGCLAGWLRCAATCNWRRRRWSRPSAGERGRGGRVVPPGGAAAANGEATSRPRRKKKERNAWPPSKRKEEIVAAGWAH